MTVLSEIPEVVQIMAARAAVNLAKRFGYEIKPELLEISQWPMEKAWDYEPPAHPIPEGYDIHTD